MEPLRLPPLPHDWCARFIALYGLAARLDALNRLAQQRLPSETAGALWLALLPQLVPLAGPDELVGLLRQVLMLVPEHPKAEPLYQALMCPTAGTAPPTAPCAAAPAPVFMITSCTRYLGKAQRLLDALQQHGACAHIVIGEPERAQASDASAALIRLPVSDAYEALTTKVLEGLAVLRRHHGPVPVVKIDDDITLAGDFSVERLTRLAAQHDYVGWAHGGVVDRCWHFGKTASPVPVFTRRRRALFALGSMYLLAPRAVDALVREWVFYPGEFDGQIYEDRAVGETLAGAGIALTHRHIADLGAIHSAQERHIACVV